MGQPKMLLPWGDVTVLERVVMVFAKAGVDDILVVTGAVREQVEEVVNVCKEKKYPVRSVHNTAYASSEMLESIQCGVRVLAAEERCGAAMIGLGDQPQVEERSVRIVAEAYLRTKSPLVVPSFEMRRGHPWLIARALWQELLEMNASQTPRDLLNRHAQEIMYVEAHTASILADMDTPEEYRRWRP